jgi:hypothetical protein
MRRSISIKRTATVKRSADGGVVELRAGDKVLGYVSGLSSQSDRLMTATFSHHPAYADFAPVFLRLARAIEAGRADEEADARSALEAAGVEVWHTSHDMRIDKPGTLSIAEGLIGFAPNDAFVMMRTGGL